MALIYYPTGLLAESIDCIWYENQENIQVSAQTLPFLNPELLFNFGDQFDMHADPCQSNRLSDHIFMGGIYTRPLFIQAEGRYEVIGVLFKPWGPYELLGISAASFASKPNAQLLAALNVLYSTLKAISSPELKLEAVAQFLSNYPKAKKVDYRVKFLIRSEGFQTSYMQRLASYYSSRSKKTMLANFKRSIGLLPTTFMQLAQINQALALVAQQPQRNLTEIGYACGFYDQSHFIRTFKKFTHLTPYAYRRALINQQHIGTSIYSFRV